MSYEAQLGAIIAGMVGIPLALLLLQWTFRKGRDWLALRLEDRARFIRAARLNRYRITPDFRVGKSR